MRKHIIRVFVGICAVFLILGFMYQEYKQEYASGEVELSFQVGEEVIQAWEEEGVYYLFLPSYANLSEVKITTYSPNFRIVGSGQGLEITSRSSLAQIPMEKELDCVLTGTGEKFRFCVMQSENLPAVFIDIQSGSLEEIRADKEYRTGAELVIRDLSGEAVADIGVKSIGGRGNTSFANYEKKPFALSLKEEASLLGLPVGEEYALLSNASDPTMVRNDISRRMEEAVGLDYSHTGRFVDLYIDGEYQGTYYLCDKLEIGIGRINITDMEAEMELVYQNSNYEAFDTYETESIKGKWLEYIPEDITGAYLFEREYKERYLHEYAVMGSGFVTEREEYFVMHSPAYCSVEQMEYISAFVGEAEKAILSKKGTNPETGKSYQDYIDIDSFVKKYLVEEASKNYDGGVSSTFFYKDSDSKGGKLCAAPGWDYDMSWGNYVDWMEYFSEDPKGISKLAFHVYHSPWYTNLYEKEEYLELVKQYYKESIAPFLNEMLEGTIDWYENQLKASARMNDIRWNVDLEANPYYFNREESFASLKTFMKERKAFLDEVWVEGQVYHTVTFWKDGYLAEIRFVKDGEQLQELPETVAMEPQFWKEEQTGAEITEDMVIAEELRFIYTDKKLSENQAGEDGTISY